MSDSSARGAGPSSEALRPFEAIVTRVADGVVVVDTDGVVRFVNPAAEQLLARSAAELLGTNLGRPVVVGKSTELAVLRKDGSLITVELRASPVTWEGAPAVLASLRDVSDRVRAQARVEHLNSLLRAIRNVNQLIVRERDPARLVQQTCELLIETRGYAGAWIATGDGRAPSLSVAQAGWGETFEPLVASLAKGEWPACWQECVDSEDAVVVREPAKSCEGCPLSGAYGDKSALTTALRHDGRVLGQLGISLPGGLTVDEEERSLLSEVAADIAFALHTIEAERLQRESDARFELVTESSPDAIFLVDRMDKVTYSNQAASELLDYSTEELSNMSFTDLASKEKVQDLQKNFQELLAVGRRRAEVELVRKDGTAVSVDSNAVLLPNDEIYASCRDLTARKVAEEALRRSEARLKLAQQVARIGHWELDAYDETPVWSDEIFRIFGLEPGSRVPSFADHEKLVHPEDWSLWENAVRASFENGEPFDLVLRIVSPGPQPRWMEAIGTATRDAGGRVVKLFGTKQDVTEREGARLALVASQERFRLVFDNTADGIALIDAATRKIVMGNNALCDLLGYTAAELTALTIADIHPAETLPDVERALARQAAGARTFGEGVAVKRRDGTIFFADIGGASTHHDDRQIFIASFRDVTETLKLRASLAQSDRLASMGTLAAGVAHEINNPLSYVLYNLESLSEDMPRYAAQIARTRGALAGHLGEARLRALLGSDAEALDPAVFSDLRDRFDDALSGSRRIKGIARGLGSFSRAEKTRWRRSIFVTPSSRRSSIASNEIKYRAHIVTEFGTGSAVLASEGRLAQVFLNLLINAAHAITEGDAESNQITIRTSQDGDAILAEVQDTGLWHPRSDSRADLRAVLHHQALWRRHRSGSEHREEYCHELRGNDQRDERGWQGHPFRNPPSPRREHRIRCGDRRRDRPVGVRRGGSRAGDRRRGRNSRCAEAHPVPA